MLYARGSDTCSVEYTGQLSVVDSRTHRPSRGTRYSALYGESESGVLAAAVVRNGPAELVCGRVRVRCAALRGVRCSVRAVGRGELPDAAGRARPRPTERRPRGCGLSRVGSESQTRARFRARWGPRRRTRCARCGPRAESDATLTGERCGYCDQFAYLLSRTQRRHSALRWPADARTVRTSPDSGLTRLADSRAKCSLCFWLVRKLPPKVDGRLHFVCALRCQVPYVAKVALS